MLGSTPPAGIVENTMDLGENTFCRERVLGPGKPLLVVFGPGELDVNRPIYRGLLAPVDCNYVIFQSRSTDFFLTDWSAITAHVQSRGTEWKARRIVSWGFSMGGYASIRLGIAASPAIDCSVAITPHFRLDAPVSRAQLLRQLPQGVERPDLVDMLNRGARQTQIRIYLPTHSIRDTIHVRDAQSVQDGAATIHYLNVDHGIEIKWKDDGSLRSAFANLAANTPWSPADRFTATPADVATACAAVDYLYQSHGEPRDLAKLADDGVMEAEWHLRKAMAFRAHRDWNGFCAAAFRALQLGAARGGFPAVCRSAFDDVETPPHVAASVLGWTLRYDVQATRALLRATRAPEIIRDQLSFDDICYLLPFAEGDVARSATLQILFRCSHEPSADLGVFAVTTASLGMADAVERMAHRAAANNIYAVANALFVRLASLRSPTQSDSEAWQRTRSALGMTPPEAQD